MAKNKTAKRKATARPKTRPDTLRDLADAVFAQRDPVAVGSELLSADSESVKARVFENLQIGPTAGAAVSGGAASPAAPAVRVIWDFHHGSREAPEE